VVLLIFTAAILLLRDVFVMGVMAALWNRAGHYIFALWFLLSFFFFLRLFSSPNISSRRLDVCRSYFYKWYGLSANLGCRLKCAARGSQDAKMTQKIAISEPSHNFIFALSLSSLYLRK